MTDNIHTLTANKKSRFILTDDQVRDLIGHCRTTSEGRHALHGNMAAEVIDNLYVAEFETDMEARLMAADLMADAAAKIRDDLQAEWDG